MMPGLIAITRDIHSQNQNVYACKDRPTTFQDHAIAAIFRTQTRADDDPAAAYSWTMFEEATPANRALVVAQNAADGYTIGGAAVTPANCVMPIDTVMRVLTNKVRPRMLVLHKIAVSEMTNLV